MAVACLQIIANLNQLVLLIINVFVALLGLCVMIVGAWAKADGRKYFTITNDHSVYTQVTVLLIVVGMFVLVIGVGGAIGALFASKVIGRIILIVYAIGLGLLVICEIAGGIAAAADKNKLEGIFRDSANETFSEYNNSKDHSERDTWNQFQKDFHCCGVESYTDYHQVFGYNNFTVPESCCNPSRQNTSSGEMVDCAIASADVSNPDNSQYIYKKGCADTIVDAIGNNLGSIAGSVIALALLQIIGIVMACFVAICKKEKTYEVV